MLYSFYQGYYRELGYIDVKRNKYYKIHRLENYEMIYKDRIQLKDGYLTYNIQKSISSIYDQYFGYIVDLKKQKTRELVNSFEVKIYEDNIGILLHAKEEDVSKTNYEMMNIEEFFNFKNEK